MEACLNVGVILYSLKISNTYKYVYKPPPFMFCYSSASKMPPQKFAASQLTQAASGSRSSRLKNTKFPPLCCTRYSFALKAEKWAALQMKEEDIWICAYIARTLRRTLNRSRRRTMTFPGFIKNPSASTAWRNKRAPSVLCFLWQHIIWTTLLWRCKSLFWISETQNSCTSHCCC